MEKAASILESHNIDAQSDKKKQKFIEKTGSGALAIITVAKVNGELTNWIATGMVNFKLVA